MKKEIIIIHHAGLHGERSTYKSIEHTHTVERGWSKVGYHKVIERDGNMVIGRDDSEDGGHTVNWNKRSLGVCLCGNFDFQPVPNVMYNRLVKVVTWWCEKHDISPDINHIVGHRDKQNLKEIKEKDKNGKLKGTGKFKLNTCPGNNLYALLPKLRNDVAAELQKRKNEREFILKRK